MRPTRRAAAASIAFGAGVAGYNLAHLPRPGGGRRVDPGRHRLPDRNPRKDRPMTTTDRTPETTTETTEAPRRRRRTRAEMTASEPELVRRARLQTDVLDKVKALTAEMQDAQRRHDKAEADRAKIIAANLKLTPDAPARVRIDDLRAATADDDHPEGLTKTRLFQIRDGVR
jgi:hypothetical protein